MLSKEEFAKRYTAHIDSIGDVNVGLDELTSAGVHLLKRITQADFLLEIATEHREKQGALQILAFGLCEFYDSVLPDQGGTQSASLLHSSMSALVDTFRTPDIFEPVSQGRGNYGALLFSQQVRSGAVVAIAHLQQAGLSQLSAANEVAKIFNSQVGLFARYKKAHGKGGDSFNGNTMRSWYSAARSKDQGENIVRNVLAAEMDVIEAAKAPSLSTARSRALNIAKHVAESQHYAIS